MYKSILATVLVATVCFSSCKKDDGDNKPADAFIYGPDVQMGNGKVRGFFEPDEHNHPQTIGIAIDEAALENLPGHETSFELTVPEAVKSTTPYNHFTVDWTPHGHGPANVYDKPHFDMHFYTISTAVQNAIDTTDPALNILPAPNFLPPVYVPEPTGVPRMGKHWVDVTSPELNPANPAPFTTTFIYGSFNGKVIFHEPMISRAFLLSKPDTAMNIPQPQAFAVPGHYPTKYQIRFDSQRKQWRIVLKDFAHR